MPMPLGSQQEIVTMEVRGAGSFEFGTIKFTMPGTYVYEIRELNTKAANYTYDTAVYTVTYEITQNGDKLEAARTITKNAGDKAEKAGDVVFINNYTRPAQPVPNNGTPGTGDENNPALLATMLFASMSLLAALTKRRNVSNKEK